MQRAVPFTGKGTFAASGWTCSASLGSSRNVESGTAGRASCLEAQILR